MGKIKKHHKKVSAEVKQKRTEIHMQRTEERFTRKLINAGCSEEQITKLLEDLDSRTVLCMPYDSIRIKTKDTETGKESYLTGYKAARQVVSDLNLTPIAESSVRFYFTTTKDKVDELVATLRDKVGRCYISKLRKPTVEEATKKKEEKKERHHTYNTSEVKKAAKKRRKELNKKKADMRPYYSALHTLKKTAGLEDVTKEQINKAIKERIRKYNKTLADNIRTWLEGQCSIKKSEEHRAKHRQLTSKEMKTRKKAKKQAKLLATIERRRTQEKAAMIKNKADLEKRAQKAAKSGKKAIQQTLELKAA